MDSNVRVSSSLIRGTRSPSLSRGTVAEPVGATCKLPCGINWYIFKSRERQCCPQGFVDGGLVACPCLKPGEATLIGSTGISRQTLRSLDLKIRTGEVIVGENRCNQAVRRCCPGAYFVYAPDSSPAAQATLVFGAAVPRCFDSLSSRSLRPLDRLGGRCRPSTKCIDMPKTPPFPASRCTRVHRHARFPAISGISMHFDGEGACLMNGRRGSFCKMRPGESRTQVTGWTLSGPSTPSRSSAAPRIRLSAHRLQPAWA